MQQLLDYNPLQTDGVTIKQATGLITLLCCFCHPRKLRLKKYSRTVCIYCLPWTVANVSFPAGRRKKKACWSRPQLPIAVDNNAYPVLPTTHSPGAQLPLTGGKTEAQRETTCQWLKQSLKAEFPLSVHPAQVMYMKSLPHRSLRHSWLHFSCNFLLANATFSPPSKVFSCISGMRPSNLVLKCNSPSTLKHTQPTQP